MPFQPGDRLGPYRIEALLGQGGMGEVYRGRDTRLGRDVALKVISQQLAGDRSSRRRFEAEARAASALNHPSIVTIYDVGETDGAPWIAMEWVAGRTLRHVVSDGALPVRQAWEIARQVADGLAAAHAAGIVHRDLKPENLMLTANGHAKILDFGLARQNVVESLEQHGDTETMAMPTAGTKVGVILGTVGYMSPEQASGRPADFRSDQFSFGVVVYELLAGRRAFDRPTAVETLSAVIREDAIPLASLRPGISDAMLAVVGRCLAKLPDERFMSTRDLASALDSLQPEASAADADRRQTIADSRVQPSGRLRSRVGPASAIAVLFAGAVALGVFGWNQYSQWHAAITAVAVLPFDNAAHDAQTEYLVDGLTTSLIDRLSRVPALTVMARGTVLHFKAAADPRQVGQTLGVGAVISGTIARRDDRVVISAELIDVASGARLWGQSYDRPFADLLRVQDSLVSEISDALRLHLSGQEKQTLAGYGTQNVEAYELYLKARYLLLNDTEEDDLEARRLFEQAEAKDPRFIDAHLGVASTYARSAGNGYAPPQQAWARMEEEAKKVLAIDANSVGARIMLAKARFQTTWDWSTAEREFRAVSNDPMIFRGNQYHGIAMFFLAIGRPDEGVALLRRAMAADPGNLESRIMFANFLAQAGQLDEAMQVYAEIARAEPSDPRPLFGEAEVLRRRGDIARAVDARRKACQLANDDDGLRAFAGVSSDQGYADAEMSLARSELVGLDEQAKTRYVSPFDVARLNAQAGNRDKAFAELELALAERSEGLTLLKVDRAWDPLRADPRFAAIVRRVAIP